MAGDVRVARLIRELQEEAEVCELQAAWHVEFIPDGVKATDPVVHALAAAASGGRASGLRTAVELLLALDPERAVDQ